MTKETLENMTVVELSSMCSELKIKHYNGKKRFTKSQMVDAILGAEKLSVEENESAIDESKVETNTSRAVENKSESAANSDKELYLSNLKMGTLVAFIDDGGKARTAKVKNKSTKNRKLKLETEYGAEYIVDYKSILWVRTGKRWPKGVYNLLKGKSSHEEE